MQSTTQKIKVRIIRTRLKIAGEVMCPGRESSYCSTIGTSRVTLVKSQVTSHE